LYKNFYTTRQLLAVVPIKMTGMFCKTYAILTIYITLNVNKFDTFL